MARGRGSKPQQPSRPGGTITQSTRWPHQSADRMDTPRSGRRRVYVLYAHGIGTRDRDRFVAETMAHLLDVIVRPSSEPEMLPGVCDDDCRVSLFGDHAHLITASGSAATEVVIQPFHWGSEVSARPAWRVGGWVLLSALALALLRLVSPWGRFVAHAKAVRDWYERRSTRSRRVVSACGLVGASLGLYVPVILAVELWLVWIVLTGVFVIALGVAAFAVLQVAQLVQWAQRAVRAMGARWDFTQRMNRALLIVTDALVWCSDGAFRRRALHLCDERIRAAAADRTVLIGHSQGGSILTEWTREADLDAHPTTLLTLGSGQGMLATLHEAVRLSAIWRIPLAIVGVVGFVVGTVVATGQFLGAVGGVEQLPSELDTIMRVWWLEPLLRPDYIATTQRQLATASTEQMTRAFEALTQTSTISTAAEGVAVFVAFTLILLAFALLFLLPLAEPIRERCTSPADGMDLSATRDIVSSPMRVLGSAARFLRIGQTGTLSDHVTYRTNGVAVWPAMSSVVRTAVLGGRFDDAARSRWMLEHRDALLEYRSQLAGLRNVRIIAVVGAIPLVSLLLPVPHDVAILIASVSVLIAVWAAVSIWGRGLPARNTALSETGFLSESGARRRQHRSIPRAVVLLGLALVVFPAFATPPDVASIVSPAFVDTATKATSLGLYAVLGSIAAAVLFVRGSSFARPAAAVAGVLHSLSWAVLGYPRAWVLCISVAVATVMVAATRLHHTRRQRTLSE